MTDIVNPPSEAQAAAAHEVDQRIRHTVRQMKGMWVELAADLYRFNRSGMWRDLGYETFEEYLAQPELELGRRWVYELIGMYEQLVIDRDVPVDTLKQLPSSKVREVLPAVRRGRVTLEQAFADVESLTRADLERRYRGLASGPEQPIDPAAEPVSRGPAPASPSASGGDAIRSERGRTFRDRGDGFCSNCGYSWDGHAANSCFEDGLPADFDQYKAPDMVRAERVTCPTCGGAGTVQATS